MKLRNFFFSTLCLLALSASFTSCDDDNEMPNDGGTKFELPEKRAYILYEGSFGGNDAGIAFYAPNGDANFQKDIFKLQNEKGIGSLAQDIIEYDDYIYVVVSGSKYISKMNEACVEISTYAFPEGEGDPRRIVAEDGYIYVTQYGGQVSKIDTKTMKRVAVFNGGDNLEGIAECKGKLYVANTFKIEGNNYIYNNEVFVINSQTMQLETTIKVATNPERLFEFDDKIYVYSKGNYFDEPNTLQIIDPAKNNELTNRETPISKISEGKGNLLYIVNNVSEYKDNGDGSWELVSSVNTFYTYDTTTGTFGESFLKNLPEELNSANIYMLNFDEDTNETYIGITDYVNTGTIYRFDANGTLKEKFDAGGLNPNNMIFVD